MKKLLIAIVAALATGYGAQAALIVNWSGPSGFTMADGITPLVPLGNSALVQLIYSADNFAGDALIGGLADGDVVLSEQMVDNSIGNDYAAGFSFVYGPEPYAAGFLYVRVFQAGTTTGGGVAAGDFYYTGPLFATVDNAGPPASPDSINAGLGGTGPGDFGTYTLNQQVVPEPSVLALLGLGALGLGYRRFRRS